MSEPLDHFFIRPLIAEPAFPFLTLTALLLSMVAAAALGWIGKHLAAVLRWLAVAALVIFGSICALLFCLHIYSWRYSVAAAQRGDVPLSSEITPAWMSEPIYPALVFIVFVACVLIVLSTRLRGSA